MIQLTVDIPMLFFYPLPTDGLIRYSHELRQSFLTTYVPPGEFVRNSSNAVAVPISTELALSLNWVTWLEVERNLPLPLRTALKIMGANQ